VEVWIDLWESWLKLAFAAVEHAILPGLLCGGGPQDLEPACSPASARE
jgi:hypothetical protein